MHYGLISYRGCFALLGYPVLCVLSAQKQEMSQILPYQLKPEYSSIDERSESEEEEEDDSIFSNANTSDRRLDTSWCLCEQCTIMPTEVESISCKGVFVENGWRYSVNQNVNFAFILFCFCCFFEWRVLPDFAVDSLLFSNNYLLSPVVHY